MRVCRGGGNEPRGALGVEFSQPETLEPHLSVHICDQSQANAPVAPASPTTLLNNLLDARTLRDCVDTELRPLRLFETRNVRRSRSKAAFAVASIVALPRLLRSALQVTFPNRQTNAGIEPRLAYGTIENAQIMLSGTATFCPCCP